ncbi:transporter substrate-binding domain-containing protein [Helicobacter cetorum]|uniref:Polar amino acid ABC transporter periplasmic protein n=1 Tax=Helicobacter cetorum (strain ATCC BAA-540 / CCUG 52418 / MIT 99-5656) TaxID=1163745 RepID=I0ER54_HELCM|nr:transporter substrate-binding domain-containing protein [Helicobacter cetorum]AFI05423.1 polar amino acid ABC transporter periplasmic protein [Helicobacter cetorum MIT 99-5656]
MKKVSYLLLITSLFLNLLSASSLYERLLNKETISVATEGTYPPFTYHNKEGKLTGYDVEVARELAKELGINIKFHETAWDIMLTGLKAGRFDMAANQIGLTTKKRQATFDESLPYSYSGTILLVRKNEERIKDIKDIKGLKAANTLSSIYGELALKYDAKVLAVDTMAQALLLVAQKRADLTLNNSLAILDYLNSHKNSPFKIAWESKEKKRAAFIINKNQEKALELINKAMQRLVDKGVLKRLGEQFFGKDVSKQ